ncbi:Gp138 family membrane-puncturing spike protein [Raoultella ornithinolytica]|uniref:Gp138 family membrane-puncturing spike protein n=1 Tax=Raoultella ornithinolytica TaxID=54291 RepID=UPI00096A8EBE|nr:Gp138 family membrane-puncturing spike protein [Raoultella ornithinolytica]
MATARPIEDREVYDSILKGAKQSVRVSMPGVIKSFDPESVTCVVEVSIYIPKPESTEGKSIDRLAQDNVFYPLILDAPVIFPRGGGCTLTFPVKEGDECLVVFADRCIDFWWQSGGVQNGSRGRMHDYSDAFVIPGPQSQAKKISGISTNAVELRSDDGSAKLSLNPASGEISGTAPGGFNLNGLQILPDGRLQLVDGSIVDKHTHGGVESGGSSTAPLGG